jgi:hypothetical protein
MQWFWVKWLVQNSRNDPWLWSSVNALNKKHTWPKAIYGEKIADLCNCKYLIRVSLYNIYIFLYDGRFRWCLYGYCLVILWCFCISSDVYVDIIFLWRLCISSDVLVEFLSVIPADRHVFRKLQCMVDIVHTAIFQLPGKCYDIITILHTRGSYLLSL